MKNIIEEMQEIQYHAVRLLVIIAYCGRPAVAPKIKGRMLMAKIDFFLRYPLYLDKACLLLKNSRLESLKAYEIDNVETRMVRYKYGPWDNKYYLVLSYLIAKDLVKIELSKNIEYFCLTDKGKSVADNISKSEVFQILVERARLIVKLFPGWSGSGLKDFIYTNFPEVVSLPIGKEI